MEIHGWRMSKREIVVGLEYNGPQTILDHRFFFIYLGLWALRVRW